MTALDKDALQRRVQEIRIFVEKLRGLSAISRADFLANVERQHAIMHLLLLSIEACLSAGNHVVARKRLGIPQNYGDIFSLMEKGGLMPADFAREMMKMARFRNRLVHVYWETDLEQIYDIVTAKLDDFERFAELINKMS